MEMNLGMCTYNDGHNFEQRQPVFNLEEVLI